MVANVGKVDLPAPAYRPGNYPRMEISDAHWPYKLADNDPVRGNGVDILKEKNEKREIFILEHILLCDKVHIYGA